jgi:hypothetical protein
VSIYLFVGRGIFLAKVFIVGSDLISHPLFQSHFWWLFLDWFIYLGLLLSCLLLSRFFFRNFSFSHLLCDLFFDLFLFNFLLFDRLFDLLISSHFLCLLLVCLFLFFLNYFSIEVRSFLQFLSALLKLGAQTSNTQLR